MQVVEMSEDVDLYDDLPVLSFGESVSKIDEERQYFKTQLDEKEKDLYKVREQIAHLEKENKTLEENLSSLYKTAVYEIKRKDQVIEELRREKESLIFRRKGRQNPSINPSTSPHTECLANKQHQVSGLPAKHTLTSVENATEESGKLAISSRDSKVCQRTIENKYYKSTSDITVSKESNEYLSRCSEGSVSVQLETGDSCNKVRIRDNNVKQPNPVSHGNNCSKTDDALADKLSSNTSATHHTHQSESREQLRESLLSQNEREKRSLSSEDKERRHVERGYDSEKYTFSRNRHRSPHNRHRPSRSHNENRRDWSWDRSDDRKFQRDLYKETDFQECKLSMGTGDTRRRKLYSHSRRRSRSPQSLRRSAPSPVQRYSDRQHVNSKVPRNIKLQSENVRLASQLKSKYSKAMRERSVSRTPVKQQTLQQVKLGSDSQPLQLQDISQTKVSSHSKLNLGKQIVSARHVGNKVSGSENSTETVLKNCMTDTIRKECGETLRKDSLVNFAVQCSSVKKKAIFPDSKTHENAKKETFEELRPVSIDIEPNNCVLSGNNSRISKSESFLTERESVSLRNSASSSKELLSQSLRTPPSKNLIPLKISPSFEDPAIIKENKFSFCVFNEQCEFRRSRRKRSVKLLVTEIKNVCVTENNEERNEPNSEHSYEDDVSKKQNTFLDKQIRDCSLEQHVSDEKTCRSSLNVNLQNEIARNQNNIVPEIQGTDAINAESEDVTQEKTTSLVEDAINCSALKTVNISSKLSEIEAVKNKSPNKKRKLDSICEELKANLEKKNATCQVQMLLGDSINIPSNLDELRGSNINDTNKCKISTSTVTEAGNCEVTSGDPVKSNQPPKHIIVSRRRRKVPNLQDNVVQVLSQIKSRIS